MVRRPDPEPCLNCAAGEPDMCLNGRFTERGIKAAHGFLAERYVEEPRYLVPVPPHAARFGVLLEPLSVVEKALDQVRRIQSRLAWSPRRALVLGAGNVGTLAVLLLRLEGLDVWVYSRGAGGRGREVAEAAGASFLSADRHRLDQSLQRRIGPIDIVIEATGHSPLAFDAMDVVGPNGVVCLTGVTTGSRRHSIDASQLNREIVLENKVAFGTVNANRRHFESGAAHLGSLEGRWPGLLERMITRRVPLRALTAESIEAHRELKMVVDVSAEALSAEAPAAPGTPAAPAA
jgi:threonine dehydrogenase-like Zn-dependent dehydrogenase